MATAVKQTVERIYNDDMVDIRVHIPLHRPSWRNTGTGHATFRMYGHRRASWLSLTTTEAYKRAEMWLSRESTLTLTPEAAVALRDALNEMYPAAPGR